MSALIDVYKGQEQVRRRKVKEGVHRRAILNEEEFATRQVGGKKPKQWQ